MTDEPLEIMCVKCGEMYSVFARHECRKLPVLVTLGRDVAERIAEWASDLTVSNDDLAALRAAIREAKP